MKMLQFKTNSSETNSDFRVIVFPIKFYQDLQSNKSLVNDESTNIFNFSLVLMPIKKNDNFGLSVSVNYIFFCCC